MGTDYNDINSVLNGTLIKSIDNNRVNQLKNYVVTIKELFRDIEPIKNEIVVYRCWKDGMLNYVEGTEYIYNAFLSTSMYSKFSKDWCIMADRKPYPNGVLARITLPAGSRVLPLLDYQKLANPMGGETEYELLLDNYGSLIETGNTVFGDRELLHFIYNPPTKEFLQNRYEIDKKEAEAFIQTVDGKKKKTNVSIRSRIKSRKSRKSRKKLY